MPATRSENEVTAREAQEVGLERARCTLCAGVESHGFYTGCMQRDEGKPINGWTCDGEGNLTRTELNRQGIEP